MRAAAARARRTIEACKEDGVLAKIRRAYAANEAVLAQVRSVSAGSSQAIELESLLL